MEPEMNLCGSCVHFTQLGYSPDYGYCVKNDGCVSGYDQQACYTPKPDRLVVCSPGPEGNDSIHGVYPARPMSDSTEESSKSS